ncbi:zinc-ribbon domain-containing protein [Ruminococcus sp. YRD2003]|uniref:zinc-ribbon domain-containing protein n=1 Tax=Ruminococcus sp. YRD2003 TaxID=1452313 RepID=UPI0008CC65E3|nr:zinc-ribbon domain-containing protein [Ruminococcus flavefaciens]
MICPNCNHEVSDLAVVCPNCGASLNNNSYNTPETEQKANGGFIALSIFFPIVGIILGIIEINKGNKSVGKKYLWAGIIAWAVWFLLGCCISIIPLFFRSHWYNTGYSQGFEYGLGNNNAIVSLLF